MKISIIILTWNSASHIGSCIKALQSTVKIQALEWIVVDNGSTDSSQLIVEQLLPEATIIQNPNNMGVAHARNQGIEASAGEYVLFIDDDTIALPNAIDKLCEHLDQQPDCAMAGPQLVNHDGTLQTNALPLPSLRIKSRRIINKIFRIPIQNQYHELIMAQKPFEPGYLMGACQLIRRKAINVIGLLDESIFYGPEDADYCFRLKKQGYKIVCLPSVKVIHAHQGKNYDLKRYGLLWSHFKGLIYYWRKHN